MSFTDIFKKSFLQGYVTTGNFTMKEIVVCMCLTILVAAYIFVVYRVLNRNEFYNKNFNISLPVMALITAAVILTIQSSIVVSLGMVGALSIVRFRTAIKNPMDLGFLFWSISAGIICGAGFVMIAIVSSIAITAVILIADALPVAKAPLVLVVNCSDNQMEKSVMEVVHDFCSLAKVKSRNLSADRLDLVVEVRTKEEADLVAELVKMEGILSASLISHDGEVTF